MNIFFIDRCPIKSAQQLCDKHVVKMVLETAQMCSTAVHNWKEEDYYWIDCLKPKSLLDKIYKPAYQNHPMTKWVGSFGLNMIWAVQHGLAIGEEYKYRYAKYHSSTAVIQAIKDHMEKLGWWDDVTERRYYTINDAPLCMPDEYKCDDYVEAYRNYYRKGKAHILKWTKREKPEWI